MRRVGSSFEFPKDQTTKGTKEHKDKNAELTFELALHLRSRVGVRNACLLAAQEFLNQKADGGRDARSQNAEEDWASILLVRTGRCFGWRSESTLGKDR